MDQIGAIYSDSDSWEVVQYAQQCGLEQEEDGVSLTRPLWVDVEYFFSFKYGQSSSLKGGENKPLNLQFGDGSELEIDFLAEEIATPEIVYYFSANIDRLTAEKISKNEIIRIFYKERLIKSINIRFGRGSLDLLDSCIKNIYQKDPFVD